MTKLNLAIILALAALASSFAPSQAQAACAFGTEIGVYRGRSVCLGKAGVPAEIPDAECTDAGSYAAHLRHYMVIKNELYCVISLPFWESGGHNAAKIGSLTDLLTSAGHCANDPVGTWKIVGTYQQSIVCMYRGSGLGDIPERICGKNDYAKGIAVQFGADKYCLFANNNNPKTGWLAALMVPECEIRHRGKHVKSVGLKQMTAEQCLNKTGQ